jgi:aminoglycoside phosphotransferase (APT) family kinase protein
VKIAIDASLVRRLIARQFPQWENLPIKPVEFSGWDNRTFHLGEHMTIRFPCAEEYSKQVEKEQFWLPKLAPLLPLKIPVPIAMGKPGEGYPWHWSVYKWLDGDTASIERINDICQFAIALAEFLVALQQIDTTDGPMAGAQNFYRGGPLAVYDSETRQAIKALGDNPNAKIMIEIWDAALSSTCQGSPVWVHGDIAVGNLLVSGGQLSAIIDFGQLGIGDPACDLAIAWTFFTGESRDAFRAALRLDAATWARGRGWALWKALCAPLPGTSPLEVQRIIGEVLKK